MKKGLLHKFVAILVLSTLSSLVFSNPASASINVRYYKNVPAQSTYNQFNCLTILDISEPGWTRDTHSFNGWNTNADGTGTSYVPGDSCALFTDGFTFLYAQWVQPFTVTFIEPASTASSQQMHVGSAQLTSNPYIRDGFNFTGWNTAANGSGTAYADQSSYDFSSNLTLYAQWESSVDPAVAAKAAADAAAKEAEEARARAVIEAKSEVKNVLTSGKPLTADQLLKADFVGVTTKNVGLVNADIAKLPEVDRTDIKQIEKVVLKFATVDKVAEGKNFASADLVAVGLIPQDSKIKTSILATLRNLPQSSLDSFEKIQAAIAAVEKAAADRKARLAAVLARRK